MMTKLKDTLFFVGENVGCYASELGSKSLKLARKVGVKRGGIALGILATAVAVPFIIRYVRARGVDDEIEGQEHEAAQPGRRSKRRGKRGAGAAAHA